MGVRRYYQNNIKKYVPKGEYYRISRYAILLWGGVYKYRSTCNKILHTGNSRYRKPCISVVNYLHTMILATSMIIMLNYKGINNIRAISLYPFVYGESCVSKVVTVCCYKCGNNINIIWWFK